MCGIFAATGESAVAGVLVEGLRRLEYRGYDSAGIAISGKGGIAVRKNVGPVGALATMLESEPAYGECGIAHTRWATHGEPSARNSHPHCAPGIAIVHNGIVENHGELRKELAARNAQFVSETDSEVIPWLVREELMRGEKPWAALQKAAARLSGSFAIAMLSEDEPGEIFAIRKGSPLVTGFTDGKAFLSSDLNALAGIARHAIALEDGDSARITPDCIDIRDHDGRIVNRPLLPVESRIATYDTGVHEHFMAKEIFEQPEVAARIDAAYHDGTLMEQLLSIDFSRVRRINFVACGTSYYAAAVARHWMQQHAGIECSVHVASEYRYEALPQFYSGEVAVLISQSGETADTLAVLERLQHLGMPVLGVVNDTNSTLARNADMALPLMAGPEIGVASTKAFTAQLMILAHLAIHATGKRLGAAASPGRLRDQLASTPDLLAKALLCEEGVIETARQLGDARSAIFVGRGPFQALACEGALKLKETSYIHAEGFAAGELKHGPLALIDEHMPVFALAGDQEMMPKLASNIREIAARNGRIHVIGDREAILSMKDVATGAITLPSAPDLVRPIITAIPLQLLSYHAALQRGLNVDRPRNLAKSVTVE